MTYQEEQEQKFLKRVQAVGLPASTMARLIMTASKEGWTIEDYHGEIARAKFLKFFDDLLGGMKEEIAVLREGQDEEC